MQTKTILAGKKSLASFYRVLSKESGEALEKESLATRKRHKRDHLKRVETID